MGSRLAILAMVLLSCTPGLLAASIMQDATAGSSSTGSQAKILVLGDSLADEGTGRQGWVNQLHSAYGGTVGLFNLGDSLPNAKDASLALSKLLNSPKAKSILSNVALVVLAFGSSEIQSAHAGSQEPWASPEAFEQHLAGMVQQLRQHGIDNIALVQPPPVASFQDALPYARIVADVGRQFQVPYVDTLSAIAAMPDWQTVALKDNRQLTDKGHNVLFSRVAAEIRRKLPTVSPEALSQDAKRDAAASGTGARATTAAQEAQEFDPSRDVRRPARPTAAWAAALRADAARHAGGRRSGRAQPASIAMPQLAATAPAVATDADDEEGGELPAPLAALQAAAKAKIAEQQAHLKPGHPTGTPEGHKPAGSYMDSPRGRQTGDARSAHASPSLRSVDYHLLTAGKPAAAEKPAVNAGKPTTAAPEKPTAEKPAANTDKPAAADKPAVDANKPTAADKPARVEKPATEKPAVNAGNPAAAEKPAVDANKPAAADKSAPAEKPAVNAGKPAAAEKPAVDANKPAAADKPAPAEKPAAEKPAVNAGKPAAADKPAVDAGKPAAADKPAVDANKPAAADKPAPAEKLATEKPAAEKPAVDAGKPAAADKPAVDANKPAAADKPAPAEKPAAERPAVNAGKPAAADKPAVDAGKPAAADKPAPAEKPVTEKPAVDAGKPAAADKPAVDANKPAAADKPAPAEKPAAEKPAVNADKPAAAEKPAVDANKPAAADKPAPAEKLATEKPATAGKPLADKPAAAGKPQWGFLQNVVSGTLDDVAQHSQAVSTHGEAQPMPGAPHKPSSQQPMPSIKAAFLGATVDQQRDQVAAEAHKPAALAQSSTLVQSTKLPQTTIAVQQSAPAKPTNPIRRWAHDGPAQPVTPAHEPTQPTMPVHEPTKPTMPVHEPTKPTMPVHEPTKPTMPVHEPTKPTMPVHEPTKPTMPVHEPTRPTMPVHEPIKPTMPVHEPTKPTMPVHEPIKPTMPVHEPTKPITPVHEPTKPTMPVHEPTRPITPVHEPTKPTMPVHEPIKPTMPVHEPIKPTMPVHEPTKPTMPVHEPIKPTMPVVHEPTKPTMPVHEPTKPITPVHEPTKPTMPVHEPTKPTMPVHEPTKPTMPVHEPIKPTMPVHEPIKPTMPVHEPTKPTMPVHEPIKPITPVHEPTKPTMPVHEPTKPTMPVHEPTKPTMPVVHEPTKPITPVHEPTKPITPVHEPTKPITPVHEPTKPTMPVREPTKPAMPVREPTKPTMPVHEPTKPTTPVHEPTKPTSPVQHAASARPTTPVKEPIPAKSATPVQHPARASPDNRPTPDSMQPPAATKQPAVGGKPAQDQKPAPSAGKHVTPHPGRAQVGAQPKQSPAGANVTTSGWDFLTDVLSDTLNDVAPSKGGVPAADKPSADAIKPVDGMSNTDKPAQNATAGADSTKPGADKPAAANLKVTNTTGQPAAIKDAASPGSPGAPSTAAGNATAHQKPSAFDDKMLTALPAPKLPANAAADQKPPTFDDGLLMALPAPKLPEALANYHPEQTASVNHTTPQEDLAMRPTRSKGAKTTQAKKKRKDNQGLATILSKITPEWWPFQDKDKDKDAGAAAVQQNTSTFGLPANAATRGATGDSKPDAKDTPRAEAPSPKQKHARAHGRHHDEPAAPKGNSGGDPAVNDAPKGAHAVHEPHRHARPSQKHKPGNKAADAVPMEQHHSTFGSHHMPDADIHPRPAGAHPEGWDRRMPTEDHIMAGTFGQDRPVDSGMPANLPQRPVQDDPSDPRDPRNRAGEEDEAHPVTPGVLLRPEHPVHMQRDEPKPFGVPDLHEPALPRPSFAADGPRTDNHALPTQPTPTFGGPRDQPHEQPREQPARPSRPSLDLTHAVHDGPSSQDRPISTFGGLADRQLGNPLPAKEMPPHSTFGSGPEPTHPEPHSVPQRAAGPSEHPLEHPSDDRRPSEPHPSTFGGQSAAESRPLHMEPSEGHKAAGDDLAAEHQSHMQSTAEDKEWYESDEGGDENEGEYAEDDDTPDTPKHREHKKQRKGHRDDEDQLNSHKGRAKGRREHKHGHKRREHKADNGSQGTYPDDKEHEVVAKVENELPESVRDGLGSVEDSDMEIDQAADHVPQDLNSAISGAEEDASKPLIVTLGDYVMRQGSFGTGIVAAGDNAPGWISRLAGAYGNKAQVVNKGQATATSQNGLAMVEELLKEYPNARERIKLVVLSFGGNDAITRTGEDKPKVPLAAYKTNLQTMVTKLREAGISNVLLVTAPPAARRVDRRFKTIKDYAKAASDVAHSMKVPTVDLFAAVSSLPNWQAAAMKEDGLRLSERGQQLLFKRVMKALNAKLQSVSPGKLVSQ